MGLFNFLPKEEQYFSLFAQMTSYIYDAASALVEMLGDKKGDYSSYVSRIKEIEHECDDLTHTVSTRLNKSFITPFDREDIFLLSGALDDIVDLIDDAARTMMMYNVMRARRTPHTSPMSFNAWQSSCTRSSRRWSARTASRRALSNCTGWKTRATRPTTKPSQSFFTARQML